jgi:hypothetical protein
MPARETVIIAAATGTGRGAGASWPSTDIVPAPAFPLAGRLWLDWNCRRAASVCGPNIPS